MSKHKPHRRLPPGLSFFGDEHSVDQIQFLADKTWVDDNGNRHVEQQIFSAVFDMIRAARRLVVVDVFLFNAFQGRVPETTRLLSGEMVDVLTEQKRAYPDIELVVITDPLNTIYGVRPSEQFEQLKKAGISVVITDLTKLRDSNPVYSWIWRWFIRPFGVGKGGFMSNPLARDEKVTIRSYLSAMNFKANHRKLILADDGDDWFGLVTSANPHDASSAHHNVAIRFAGSAVADLLSTENAVLKFSGRVPLSADIPSTTEATGIFVRVLTERAVKTAALVLLDGAAAGEHIDLATFYLSDRAVIRSLLAAHGRGVCLRILLDPNKDAFGHDKRGIPNRPVAAELVKAGIGVRWVHTHGEQCHAKTLLRRSNDGEGMILLGSTNLTRRNLDDFNLETNVLVRAPVSAKVFADAQEHFDALWENRPQQIFSVPYEHYRNESIWKRLDYRFGEASGISTY